MNNQPLRGPASFDRERELLDQRQRAADDMAHREREQSERAHRESYHANVPPHQSSAGSIPIHQPVASRMPGIHSPSGLLANHGSSSAISLGTPSGPVAGFGGPLHEQGNRPPVQHAPPPGTTGPQHQLFGAIAHAANAPSGQHGAPNAAQSLFGGPLPPQDGHGGAQPNQGPGGAQGPPQGGPGAANQGQQPILNVSDRSVFYRDDGALGGSRTGSLVPYCPSTACHRTRPNLERHVVAVALLAGANDLFAIGCSHVSRPGQGSVPRPTRSLQQVLGYYEGLQEPVVRSTVSCQGTCRKHCVLMET